MATAPTDGDAASGQTQQPTDARLAPGEGLPANLYKQVKLAIYQSHGMSLIAATMQAKLDECHGPFQLQKFLIRWGGQFSKLAMFGVRLEMMATARSPPDEIDPASEDTSKCAEDFKKAVIKHAAIAKATREEHAARARQLQEHWAAVMSRLDEQEAALDEERTKNQAHSRTESGGHSEGTPQENTDNELRSHVEKSAKPTTQKMKKSRKGASRTPRWRPSWVLHCLSNQLSRPGNLH